LMGSGRGGETQLSCHRRSHSRRPLSQIGRPS
jgi:hypothetical protein